MATIEDDEELRPVAAAMEALSDGDADGALSLAREGLARARREGDDSLAADLLWVAGASLIELGRAEEALRLLDEALSLAPDHLDARLERGSALYELCRFEEAERELTEVERDLPDDGAVQHLLGLVAERRGDRKQASRRLEAARRLEPGSYPRPTTLSREEFDATVEAALAAIPEPVRRYLANVPVTVEELPEEHDLLAADPPLSPSILGLFRGAPYGQKSSMDPWSHLPSSIVLYQRNLERFAGSREELVEEIGVTLVHEVGHFLGLDEEELWARGLD